MPAPGDAYGNEVWADTPAWWARLDETTGTSAADYMGGAAGTIAGSPALNQTPVILTGKSVLFDGVNDKVTFPDSAATKPTNLTVETWVNVSSGVGAFGVIVTKTTSSAWSDGWGMYAAGPGTVRFWVTKYNGTPGHFIDASVSAGAAHHLVGTFDGSVIRMYVDGAEVAGSPVTHTAALVHSTNTLAVGDDTFGDPFTGKIDEVAIYPTALSAGRVVAHYSAGSGSSVFVDLAGSSEAGGDDIATLTVVAGGGGGGSPTDVVISRPAEWPDGTLVTAYAGNAPIVAGGPVGAPLETAVAASGSVTFLSLIAGRSYVLSATVGGQPRPLRVIVAASSLADRGVGFGTGVLTAGSRTVTGVVTTSGVFQVGQRVAGSGVDTGTRISGVSGSTLTLTTPARVSGTVALEGADANTAAGRVLRRRAAIGTS